MDLKRESTRKKIFFPVGNFFGFVTLNRILYLILMKNTYNHECSIDKNISREEKKNCYSFYVTKWEITVFGEKKTFF